MKLIYKQKIKVRCKKCNSLITLNKKNNLFFETFVEYKCPNCGSIQKENYKNYSFYFNIGKKLLFGFIPIQLKDIKLIKKIKEGEDFINSIFFYKICINNKRKKELIYVGFNFFMFIKLYLKI